MFALPAVASAATLTVDDDGDQCPVADFTTIQGAVNAAAASGDTIHVCAGTYVEQVTDTAKNLTIDGDGATAVTVRAPSSLSAGPCDSASPNRPVVCFNSGANATIQDLTVDGNGNGNANNRIVGIAYRNAAGTVQDTSVIDVRNNPFDGIQGGVGVLVSNADAATRTMHVTDNTVSRFQKTGIALDGSNLTIDVAGNTVTGVGPQNKNAQNAIQVSGGATGTVDGNTLSDIEYTPNTFCSTGVLLFNGTSDVQVSNNSLTDIHCGIFSQDGTGTEITGNALDGSRYGVTLFDNPATVNGNTIAGGPQGDSEGIFAAEDSGSANFDVTANGNTLTDHNDGALIVADFDVDAFRASMTAHFNRIAGNTFGAENSAAGTFDAANNWWGCNAGPGSSGCDPVSNTGGLSLVTSPQLVLGLSANPTTIQAGGQTSQATADLTHNSSGAVAGTGFPNGTSVAFVASLGTIQSPKQTAAGQGQSTLTSGSADGTSNVSATLDNQTVSTPVTITPQTQPLPGQLTLGAPQRNKKKGTAILPANVPAAGTVELTGKGLKTVTAEASGASEVDLKMKAKGKTKKRLKHKGKAKVTAEVVFTPSDGKAPENASKGVKLVKK